MSATSYYCSTPHQTLTRAARRPSHERPDLSLLSAEIPKHRRPNWCPGHFDRARRQRRQRRGLCSGVFHFPAKQPHHQYLVGIFSSKRFVKACVSWSSVSSTGCCETGGTPNRLVRWPQFAIEPAQPFCVGDDLLDVTTLETLVKPGERSGLGRHHRYQQQRSMAFGTGAGRDGVRGQASFDCNGWHTDRPFCCDGESALHNPDDPRCSKLLNPTVLFSAHTAGR